MILYGEDLKNFLLNFGYCSEENNKLVLYSKINEKQYKYNIEITDNECIEFVEFSCICDGTLIFFFENIVSALIEIINRAYKNNIDNIKINNINYYVENLDAPADPDKPYLLDRFIVKIYYSL